MQRFTISLDDELALAFDQLIADRGYENRSEAVRDLIRERLGSTLLAPSHTHWCAATVSYVYDHHEHLVTGRLMAMQHEHHDLVISSTRTHLDHDNCLETVVLRGPTAAVMGCASQMIALRGVRHGHIHQLALREEGHAHRHSHGSQERHRHLTPTS